MKRYREQVEASQKQFATLLGFSQQNYSQIETGKRDVTSRQLSHIASKLGISMSYLLKESDEPKPKNTKQSEQESAEIQTCGKYLKKTYRGYVCLARTCAWRDRNGVCHSGAGCLKEWLERKGWG